MSDDPDDVIVLTVLYVRPRPGVNTAPKDVNYSLTDGAHTYLAGWSVEQPERFFGDLYRVAGHKAHQIEKSREILNHFKWEVVREQVETNAGVVLCEYLPLTGPVPDGLAPGAEFTHHAVAMSPELAQALLDRYTDGARPLSVQHVEVWLGVIQSSQDDPEFTALHDKVHVSRSGETIAGQHLLHAVIRSGVTVPVDVVHNSERSWP